jgi:hypothetical protein
VPGSIPSLSWKGENGGVVFGSISAVEAHLEVLKDTKELQVREKILETLSTLTP